MMKVAMKRLLLCERDKSVTFPDNHFVPSLLLGVGIKVYNMRKLKELPHHLLHAQQLDKLKSETLVNYEWTLAKLRATSLRCVLDDIQSALTAHPNDLELRLLSDALHLSTSALTKVGEYIALIDHLFIVLRMKFWLL